VNNLTVTTPEIAFETAFSSLGLGSLDVFTEFATFRIGEIDFFASAEQEAQDEEDSSLTDIFAYLTLDNVWLLHNIINRFMGAFDSRIRVRGAQIGTVEGATLLSQVLNRFEITADIATTKDQFDEFGNPVAIGETVDPPSFWYPTQCEGSWDTYESASNSLSTTIQIPNLQNLTKMTLPLDLVFENFQLSALYV
jgi:hypothetical protein